MPVFDYRCKDCGRKIEVLVLRTGEPAPRCTCGGQTARIVGGPFSWIARSGIPAIRRWADGEVST